MTATFNPRYHPACTHLCTYATGHADEGLRLFIAAHLALCPACRQRLQTEETKAGINLEDMPPEAMDTACLENLLLRIEEHGPPACIDVTIPPRNTPASFIPDVLQEYLGAQLDEFLWQAEAGGHVYYYHQRHVTVALPSNLQLMRFAPGAKINLSGKAMLLVLEGEARGWFGKCGPGDVLKSGLGSLGARAERETLVLTVKA